MPADRARLPPAVAAGGSSSGGWGGGPWAPDRSCPGGVSPGKAPAPRAAPVPVGESLGLLGWGYLGGAFLATG